MLRERGIAPMAITSLLSKLGTSANVEARNDLATLASEFGFDKIGRAPARFDDNDLNALNAILLRERPFESVRDELAAIDERAVTDPRFWETVKANCERLGDVGLWVDVVYGTVAADIADEDADFIKQAAGLLPHMEFGEGAWKAWTAELKEKTGRKGKGLFMPLRKALTGQSHGPDMGIILQLMGRERAKARLG